jgi:hypothetical protein
MEGTPQSVTLTDRETIHLQLAMAFGQGAGSLIANKQAMEKLLGIFATRLGKVAWPDGAAAVFEFTRVLGQLAAARAVAHEEPHLAIAAEDITFDEHVLDAKKYTTMVCGC